MAKSYKALSDALHQRSEHNINRNGDEQVPMLLDHFGQLGPLSIAEWHDVRARTTRREGRMRACGSIIENQGASQQMEKCIRSKRASIKLSQHIAFSHFYAGAVV
jgi:hypothetical protein